MAETNRVDASTEMPACTTRRGKLSEATTESTTQSSSFVYPPRRGYRRSSPRYPRSVEPLLKRLPHSGVVAQPSGRFDWMLKKIAPIPLTFLAPNQLVVFFRLSVPRVVRECSPSGSPLALCQKESLSLLGRRVRSGLIPEVLDGRVCPLRPFQ